MYKKKILYLETYPIGMKIFILTVILRMLWGGQSVLSSDLQITAKFGIVYKTL